MELVFIDGNLDPFLSPRIQRERAIRAQHSEGVILQAHDAVYSPAKQALRPVNDAIEAALREELEEELEEAPGVDPNAFPRAQQRRSIATLRSLLDEGAKERTLQDALISSGLLAATCKVVQEVAMQATEDHRGMRMDLVLAPAHESPTQVIELKRGSHLLLARRGTPTKRLSRQLTKAIKQLHGYGHRLESDTAVVANLEEKHGIQVQKPELRLIAGRRLSDENEYLLLSAAETEKSASGLQLQIYTWDGFMAELERIVD
ncbi:MAG: DUF4263 domain-containing protein [Nitrospiraceae bacterium]